MSLPIYYYVLGTPLGMLGLIRWGCWLVRRIPAALYRPVTGSHRLPMTIVVPVYQEDPEVFATAIESWLANGVEEVILVIDVSDRTCQEVAARYPVRVLVTDVPGKRDALRRGWNAARTELVALVDSDTVWAPDVAVEVCKPFADPRIGGVGTRQNVYGSKGFLARITDMFLDHRYFDENASQSLLGQAVSCLSGRTAIYRRRLLLEIEYEFMHETFWGVPCLSGDDKRLTTLVLERGYRTYMQRTAEVWSTFPSKWRIFFRQRLRWARNTWRSDLRALSRRWVWRHPFLAYTMVDKGVSGFTLLFGPAFMIYSLVVQNWVFAGVLALWWQISRSAKLLPHLIRRPSSFFLVPGYLVVSWLMALIKLQALLTIRRQRWLTRQVAVQNGAVVRTDQPADQLPDPMVDQLASPTVAFAARPGPVPSPPVPAPRWHQAAPQQRRGPVAPPPGGRAAHPNPGTRPPAVPRPRREEPATTAIPVQRDRAFGGRGGRSTLGLIGVLALAFGLVGLSPAGRAAAEPLPAGARPALVPAQGDPVPTPRADSDPGTGTGSGSGFGSGTGTGSGSGSGSGSDTGSGSDPGSGSSPGSTTTPEPQPEPEPDPTTTAPVPTRDPIAEAQAEAAKAAQELARQRAEAEAEAARAAQELARKRAQEAAEAAANLAAAQQRTAEAWQARGRPQRMIVIRDLSVEVVNGGRLTAQVPRSAGVMTLAGLDRLVPSGWLTLADGDARLAAVVTLTPGTTLDFGGVHTLRLAGGATAAEAASIYTGSGRLTGRGVTVTSVDPATNQPMPPGVGRPFIVVAGGGHLDTTDVTFSDLGTPLNDPGNRTGVQLNPGSAGSMQRTTFLRNTVGLRLSETQGVSLDGVRVADSVSDGLVLDGDRATTLHGVTAEANGGNGVLVKGAATDRPITGITTSGNGIYGLAVVGQTAPRILGVVTGSDKIGGLRLNRSKQAVVTDFTATDQPIAVFTHVGSSGVLLDGLHITGGRRGVVVEKSTTGLELKQSTIEGTTAVGISLGGHDITLDGVSVTGAKTGVRVERGAGGITARGLMLSGGGNGFVANPGSSGVVLRDFTATSIGDDAIRTYSPGAQISAGRIVGAQTGIVTGAPTTIADTAITEVGVGISARTGAVAAVNRIDIAALTVGINNAPGKPVQLRDSRVHALQALRGEVQLLGFNDLSLPPLNLLGAIGVPLVLLAVFLELMHSARQRRFGRGGGRRVPPMIAGAGA